MPIPAIRLCALLLAGFILVTWTPAKAQARPVRQKEDPQGPSIPGAQYSGMYSFLREGEFVQVTVEDHGHLIGFISRYSESESGGFVDHFIKSGTLSGNQLAFTTQSVQGVSFEFRGTGERGEGKNRGDDGYYVLKGTLIENRIDAAKKTSSHSSEVVLKSFPQDLASPQTENK